jgi:hypothetical protein
MLEDLVDQFVDARLACGRILGPGWECRLHEDERGACCRQVRHGQ